MSFFKKKIDGNASTVAVFLNQVSEITAENKKNEDGHGMVAAAEGRRRRRHVSSHFSYFSPVNSEN